MASGWPVGERRNQTQEKLFQQWKLDVQNILIASKTGIDTRKLEADLEENVGKVPFKAMGFNGWGEFLYAIKDIFHVGHFPHEDPRNFRTRLFLFINNNMLMRNANADVAGIAKLVQGQGKGKTTKRSDGTTNAPTPRQVNYCDPRHLMQKTSTADSRLPASSAPSFNRQYGRPSNSGRGRSSNGRPRSSGFGGKGGGFGGSSSSKIGSYRPQPTGGFGSSSWFNSTSRNISPPSRPPQRMNIIPSGFEDDSSDDDDGFDYFDGGTSVPMKPVPEDEWTNFGADVVDNSRPRFSLKPESSSSRSNVQLTTTAKLEVKPEPIKSEVKPEPIKPEVKPEPIKPESSSSRSNVQLTTTAKLEVKPEPIKSEVKPEPIKPEVKPEPIKPESRSSLPDFREDAKNDNVVPRGRGRPVERILRVNVDPNMKEETVVVNRATASRPQNEPARPVERILRVNVDPNLKEETVMLNRVHASRPLNELARPVQRTLRVNVDPNPTMKEETVIVNRVTSSRPQNEPARPVERILRVNLDPNITKAPIMLSRVPYSRPQNEPARPVERILRVNLDPNMKEETVIVNRATAPIPLNESARPVERILRVNVDPNMKEETVMLNRVPPSRRGFGRGRPLCLSGSRPSSSSPDSSEYDAAELIDRIVTLRLGDVMEPVRRLNFENSCRQLEFLRF